MRRQLARLGVLICFVCPSGLVVAQELPPGGFQPPIFVPVPVPAPLPRPTPLPIEPAPEIERPPELQEEPDQTPPPQARDLQLPSRKILFKDLVRSPREWRKKIEELEKSPLPPKAPPRGVVLPRIFGRPFVERRVDPIDGGAVVGENHPDLKMPTVTVVAAAAASGAEVPDTDQPPAGGWESQYQRCRQAQQGRPGEPAGSGLDSVVDRLQLEDLNIDPFVALRNAKNGDVKEFQDRVREYDAACLTDSADMAPPPAEIAELAGVFTRENGPFCAGLLVNRSTVVTARHCFFTDSGLMRRAFDPSANDIQFHLTGDAERVGHRARLVQENSWYIQRSRPSATDDRHDYLFVKIDPVPHDPPKLPISTVTPGDQFVVYSFSLLVYLADYITFYNETGSSPPRTSFANALRWDRSPRCFTFAQQDTCIYHLCQTAGGYSGAPMFRFNRDAKRFEIVGLHTSAMGTGEECAASEYEGIGNIGIMPGEDLQIASRSVDWASFVQALTQ